MCTPLNLILLIGIVCGALSLGIALAVLNDLFERRKCDH